MMLSSPLRASLVALVASVVAVSAAPAINTDINLTVVASLPSSKGDGSENMKVTTTVTNTGNKPVKLLKDPRGVLSSFPENSFKITGPTGSHPSFTGARVKYSPKYAAGLDDTKAYTVLPPGGKIDVTHDLTKAYDFTKSGTGEYSVEPSNLFTIVDAGGAPKDVYATVGKSTKVKLSGDLPAPRVHDRRATFHSCSSEEQSQLETAAKGAHAYANGAYNHIAGVPGETIRYTTWFGKYDKDRKGVVENHFELIKNDDFSRITYDCTCTDVDTFAYVYPNDSGTIYLCGAFWKAPPVGTDSQAGTLIHEASHFTIYGGTKDYAYGQDACEGLAMRDPAKAVLNADSHEYFAENDPPLA